MQTLYEGNAYKFNYDGLMGVGNFERVKDGALTDLETGSDCAELVQSLKGARPDILDAIASEYSFTIDPYAADEFTRAYMECALWSSTDDNGDPLDARYTIDDISQETLATMFEDCRKFQEVHKALLDAAYASEAVNYDASQAGHDFWLTRCGHGAGFWDRGLGDAGQALADACGFRTAFDNVDIYLGGDGSIYA